MSITQVFFKIWRGVSIPLLVIVLLIAYFNLPGQVVYSQDETGATTGTVSKDQLFYGLVAVILVLYLLFSLLSHSLSRFMKNWFSKDEDKAQAAETLGKTWPLGLNAAMNTFLFLTLVALQLANSDQPRGSFDWIIYIMGPVILAVMAYFPIKLSKISQKGDA